MLFEISINMIIMLYLLAGYNRINCLMSEGVVHSIDDYELLCVIGRGSFGKIYLVRELSSGQVFAMKVVKKKLI